MDTRHTAAHRLLADGRPSYTPGIASDYIYHLPELLAENPDAPVLLHNRVSTAAQARAGNLDEAREHDPAICESWTPLSSKSPTKLATAR